MAPEVLMAGPSHCLPSGPKSDVWSLGIILLEVALHFKIWSNYALPQLFAKILLLGKYGSSQHPLDTILKEHSLVEKFEVRGKYLFYSNNVKIYSQAAAASAWLSQPAAAAHYSRAI